MQNLRRHHGCDALTNHSTSLACALVSDLGSETRISCQSTGPNLALTYHSTALETKLLTKSGCGRESTRDVVRNDIDHSKHFRDLQADAAMAIRSRTLLVKHTHHTASGMNCSPEGVAAVGEGVGCLKKDTLSCFPSFALTKAPRAPSLRS